MKIMKHRHSCAVYPLELSWKHLVLVVSHYCIIIESYYIYNYISIIASLDIFRLDSTMSGTRICRTSPEMDRSHHLSSRLDGLMEAPWIHALNFQTYLETLEYFRHILSTHLESDFRHSVFLLTLKNTCLTENINTCRCWSLLMVPGHWRTRLHWVIEHFHQWSDAFQFFIAVWPEKRGGSNMKQWFIGA
jgi:hypothetical protein